VGNMYGSMNVKVNVCRFRIKDYDMTAAI